MTEPTLDVVEVIRTKRDGSRLSDEQIDGFINAYTSGGIADEQASALLMAIFWRGMEPEELAHWTEAMIASGERMDLSSVESPTVDKHSTGGVGDKISIPLAPLVAACGVAVPMMSGRGLGHTGGTLDKLESIPGFNVALSPDEILRVLEEAGAVIYAAGERIAPADKKLYALRDVTGTVESIPLIASSIMSKKIAEGTDSLVLDVKVGSGAFMKELDDARSLAETMVGIGQAHDVKTSALITNMDEPLGRTAGNALEIQESIEILSGEGPTDVRDLTVALAEEMLRLSGVEGDPGAALEDGSAMARYRLLVKAQGGDPDADLPEANDRRTWKSPAGGIVQRIDALKVGVAAWRLGAGRSRKEDPVSDVAGIRCLVERGDAVEEGQPLLELHSEDARRFDPALAALDGAVEIGPGTPEERELVIERIT